MAFECCVRAPQRSQNPAAEMGRPVRGRSATATAAGGDRRTAREVVEATMPILLDVLRAWHSTLPDGVAATWRRGAVYIRESTISSGVGNSPEMQLRNTLLLLATKNVWVPETGIFFDVASGASLTGRVAFQRLFEESLAGGFEVIGVFGADRLFRNQVDAMQIRRAFREHGIELEYLGKFQGDPKDAASYQLDAIVDMQSHVHAHMASQNVGRHFEALSRAGRPVTTNPEAYEPIEWAPSFLGRPGSIVNWKLLQPLADIISEGCKRFLAGSTLTEVAAWSATTELGGVTPRKHPMDMVWWRQTLTNPKYAGFQHPTVWPGFKPTNEERKKARAEALSELVVCVLPALWDRDTYDRILGTLKARWRGPKVRAAYRDYLLSGITFDEECGHRISVSHSGKPHGHFWMTCTQRTIRGREARNIRADIAEQEVDEIIAAISFDDSELIEQIEVELGKLIATAAEAVETFRSNPEIAALRQALAALDRVDSDISEIRAEILRRMQELQALDEAHRELLAHPVVEFRAAMSHLAGWASVWRDSDIKSKNKLLREAEVEVWLGRLPEEKRKPAHVRRITSANPVFNLALVAGLATFNSRYPNIWPLLSTNVEIGMAFADQVAIGAQGLGLAGHASGVTVSLSSVRGFPQELDAARGPWCTPAQVAIVLGRGVWYVCELVARGDLAATKLERGRKHSLWVSRSDLNDFRLQLTRPAHSRVYSGKASPEMVTWIRDALQGCPVSRRALARRARVTPESICSIEEGRHATSKDVAVKVARAMLLLAPSPSGEALLATELGEAVAFSTHLAANRIREGGPSSAAA